MSSLVYEANARIKDPIYGSAGTIWHLQKQVGNLQAELAKAQAELINLQCQQTNLTAFVCKEMTTQTDQQPPVTQQISFDNQNFFLNDTSFGADWEPLWA